MQIQQWKVYIIGLQFYRMNNQMKLIVSILSQHGQSQYSQFEYIRQVLQQRSDYQQQMNTKQLKQFIQHQVFEILTEIKQEIQTKIIDIDSNILQIKKDISSIIKHQNQSEPHISQIQHKIKLIQNQLTELTNCSKFNKNELIQNKIKTYQNVSHNQSTLTNNSKQIKTEAFNNNTSELLKTLPYKKENNNSYKFKDSQSYLNSNQDRSYSSTENTTTNNCQLPLFKKTSQNSFDLSSLLLDDLEQDHNQSQQQIKNTKVQQNKRHLNQQPSKNQKSIPIESNHYQYQNSSDIQSNYTTKPFMNTSKVVSPLCNNSKQKKPPLPSSNTTNLSPANQLANKKQISAKVVQEQLSKNKKSFMRKKNSMNSEGTIQQREAYLEESHQLNIELQYSKDSIDNFNTEKSSFSHGFVEKKYGHLS